MRRPWWLMPAFAGLVVVAGGASSDEDTLNRNRLRLDKLRADPAVSARLNRDLKAFFDLPAERQRQVRDLDSRLHAGDLGRQARLWAVLERYGLWLDSLSEKDRGKVLDAPTAEDRLTLIRFFRDKEWADRAAPVVRLEINKLPPEQRQREIARLRAEERKQRRLWDKSLPSADNVPKPAAFNDLPEDVKAFVLEELLPAMPEDRFAILGSAEGRWPDYPRTIHDLTRAYVTYRPLPSGPIRNQRDLPADARKLMADNKGKFKGLALKLGWPDYPLAFEKACREAGLKCPDLGAGRPSAYPAATQAWVKQHLAEHMTELTKLEEKWPQWPERVMELAKAKGMAVPGMTPPGPAAMWEAALAAK